MSEFAHIVIAGGGMVGISLALRLAQCLPSAMRITLVEAMPLPTIGAEVERPAAAPPPPSFDARATALSLSSQQIFARMGLWPALSPALCPIETIHVSSRGHFGSSVLRAADQGWPALGWVAENASLGRVLIDALRAQPRLQLINPARVQSAVVRSGGVQLQVVPAAHALGPGDSAQSLHADLLVIADGARSELRAALGIGAREKPYGQQGVIANLAFAEDHGRCAWERFTDDGPLALLPLPPAVAMPRRLALVWSVRAERSDDLLACSEQEFARRVQAQFGYRLGRIERVGERHAYPLSLIEAEEQVRRHVVVLGNAAHALHPVAGQGFNLALRDVEALVQTLRCGVADGLAPGELRVLQNYLALQQGDQRRTVMASDLLPALFMHADPLLSLGRELALSALDIAPALKRGFVRQAAGISALDAAAVSASAGMARSGASVL